MKIYDVEQGSQEWFDLRKGVPTASAFGRIITPSKREFSGSALPYAAQLISEKQSQYYPRNVESYTSRSMEFGQQLEAEARDKYALVSGFDVRRVGFIKTDDDRFGCSPDGLIWEGDKPIGGLELKVPEPKTHMKWLLGPTKDDARLRWEANDRIPLEHLCQCHGFLIVTGLPWIDFYSYSCSPDCKDIRIRVVPNDFTMALRVCLEKFWKIYQQALEEVSVPT